MLFNDKYEILTSNGFQNFSGIKRAIHKSSITLYFDDETNITVTEKHKFFIDNRFKYVEEINIGDIISNKIITEIIYSKHDERFFYDLIEVENGHHYTTSGVESSNCAFIRPNIYQEFIDSFLPSQSALAWKKNIIISTAKGMNHYYELVKGASPKYETDGSGIKERGSNGYTLFKVDWRDVPRYDSKGNNINPEEFMNKIVAKHGILYWKQNYECVDGSSYINIYDKYNNEYKRIKIEEFEKLLDNQ